MVAVTLEPAPAPAFDFAPAVDFATTCAAATALPGAVFAAALAAPAPAGGPRNWSMIAGFSSVEMSSLMSSPRAIARSSRRMILPLRVFGRLSAKRISSGLAIAPSCSATQSRSSFASVPPSPAPGRKPRQTTNADTASPLISCGRPTTAASAIRGCATSADSISIVPRRCPATFSTSSMRPMIQKQPSLSRCVLSPAT